MRHRLRQIVTLAALALATLSSPVFASQGTGCMPTGGIVSGVAFATDINAGIAALISSNSGGAAPATDCSGVAVRGQVWLDTSTGTPLWRVYDGSVWTTFGAFDTANHIWTPVVGGGVGAVASATTADLCSTPQASLTITGTTTIAGFGSSCVVGQIKILTFSGALTLTNSGTLTLPSGADIVTAAGDRAIVSQVAAGTWAVFSYQRASGQPVVTQSGVYLGQVDGLVITNGATPALQMVVTARAALIPNAAGSTVYRRTSINQTCSMATSGASGLDTGAVAANTLYSVWLIDNGTAPVCLFSLSASSPTLPGGYTNLLRVGWVKTAPATTSLLYSRQAGRKSRVLVTAASNTASLPAIITGIQGNVTTPTYQPQPLAAIAPSTAVSIDVVMDTGGANIAVAPNANYGVPGSHTNPPPCSSVGGTGSSVLCTILLEGASPSLYYVSNGTLSGAYLAGWDDSVNAN